MGSTYSKAPEVETKYFPEELAKVPQQTGKVIAVTGTTSGTGFTLAKALAQKDAKVLLLNRPSERSTKSLAALKEAVPEGDFEAVDCDLQSFESVRAAAETVKGSVDKVNALVCNAGVMALADERTGDGYDLQIQTNVLSHFLLTKELFPLLVAAEAADGEARVVTHSSGARRGGPLEAKYFQKCEPMTLGGNGSNMVWPQGARWKRYQQTKLAALCISQALGDKCAEAGLNILSTSCHPGLAATNLQVTTASDGGMGGWFTNQFMKLSQSQDDGTCGLLHATAATDPIANKGFYGPKGITGPAVVLRADFKSDTPEQKDLLWGVCEAACGAFPVKT
ncbi:Uncharacterized oxidoreductase C736.13 [Durusdinium trenchii]|uniref:Uncharacterized oxidoreductase C736.13 n=1 Tax=Durusdinium trenchii TaxID=1381693 RepID=A0ABP0KRR0_9DINO